MESSFDSTNFLVRYLDDPGISNQGRILTDTELNSHVTFSRPLEIRGPISITFLNQPIDMTKSFTVVYWAKMTVLQYNLSFAQTRTLITEHFDTILYTGTGPTSVIEGNTQQDPIWNSRKRNVIELHSDDNSCDCSQVNQRITTWAKDSTSSSTIQEYKSEQWSTNTHGDHSHEYRYNFVSWKKIIISYNHVAKRLTSYHCDDNGTQRGVKVINNVEYTTTAGYLRFYLQKPHGGKYDSDRTSPKMEIDGLRIIRGQALTPSDTLSYSKTDASPTVDSSGEVTNTLDYYCKSQPSVDCYVPVGSTSTYLKKQGYNFLDGDQKCILSQTDCEPLTDIEASLSNACERKECKIGGTNVGYSWSNAKFESLGTDSQGNPIEIYGRCVPNTTGNQVCDEIGATYILSNTEKGNPNEHFDVKSRSYTDKFTDISLGAPKQHNKIPNGPASGLNRYSVVDIREDYPIKLIGGYVITFKSQPIDMTKSFTVIYWITAPPAMNGCVLITEHKDVPLLHNGSSPVTKMNEDPIWNSRKRNTIEFMYWDANSNRNSGKNNEVLWTWAKDPDNPNTPQRHVAYDYVAPTEESAGHTINYVRRSVSWENWRDSPVLYYESWRKIAIVHDASAKTLTAYHYDESGTLKLKHEANPGIEYTTTEGYLRFVNLNSTVGESGATDTGYRPVLIDGVQILRNQALTQEEIESNTDSTWTKPRSLYHYPLSR